MKSKEEWFKCLVVRLGGLASLTREDVESIQTDARADLLDRIKVLEGRLFLQEAVDDGQPTLNDYFVSQTELTKFVDETITLKSLLHRCLNTGLRDDKTRPLYFEVCRVLGVDPDKPWDEPTT